MRPSRSLSTAGQVQTLSALPPEPKVFYDILVFYFSCADVKPRIPGIRSDFERFKSRRKTAKFVGTSPTLDSLRHLAPAKYIFSDGSASLHHSIMVLRGGVYTFALRPVL